MSISHLSGEHRLARQVCPQRPKACRCEMLDHWDGLRGGLDLRYRKKGAKKKKKKHSLRGESQFRLCRHTLKPEHRTLGELHALARKKHPLFNIGRPREHLCTAVDISWTSPVHSNIRGRKVTGTLKRTRTLKKRAFCTTWKLTSSASASGSASRLSRCLLRMSSPSNPLKLDTCLGVSHWTPSYSTAHRHTFPSACSACC